MNPWTERILERAVAHLEDQGKTIDESVDILIGNPKEVIDKVILKNKLKAEKVK